MELSIGTILIIVGLAFAAEYMDSTLGMGYGTSLTPILMIMGFEPMQIVPAVLLSELITGLCAGFTHHLVGNVDFRPRTMRIPVIIRSIKLLGISRAFVRGTPPALRVALLIGLCSVVGSVAAVVLAVAIPALYVKIYIAALILVMGVGIILTLHRRFAFSWPRTVGLAVLASFNKGISGGGYGPVVTSGQLLAGVDEKNAVAITSLAEALTCFVGLVSYAVVKGALDMTLAPILIAGAVLSVPLSAVTVREMDVTRLRLYIGIATIVFGVLALAKVVGG